MTSLLHTYITEAMNEAKREHEEKSKLTKFYRLMHVENLIRRADHMGDVPSRKRITREIAEELIALHGDFAYVHALEKLDGYKSNEMTGLWRDVLTWLDELGGNDGGVDKGRDGCGEEH